MKQKAAQNRNLMVTSCGSGSSTSQHIPGDNVGRCDFRSICPASSICQARFNSVQRFCYLPKIKHVTCISIGPSNIRRMSALSQIFVQLPAVSGSGGVSSHLLTGHFEETIRIVVVRHNDPRSWRQAKCQVFQRNFTGVALFCHTSHLQSASDSISRARRLSDHLRVACLWKDSVSCPCCTSLVGTAHIRTHPGCSTRRAHLIGVEPAA